VLVGVPRQRQERLELAGGSEPSLHRDAGTSTPGLDGEGKLRGPQHEGCQRGEQLIAPSVEEIDETAESLHFLRGGGSLPGQGLLQTLQGSGGEGFPL